ncbi:MAG: site-specific integrase [Asticcacaulis sp.]|uniref:tyrosine-type recombinase/integrase n=1 Tax=Asticcacaulis sp. TaxID=1872648 RepID=UPI0039E66761
MSIVYDHGEQAALFDQDGRRKYLCKSEGRRFLRAAAEMDKSTHLFCCLLYFTGCRISEALEVTPRRLDVEGRQIIFRTLKRRKRVFRAVPVPAWLISELQRCGRNQPEDAPLWSWCRQTAWRHVKKAMAAADISGPQAVPRGLRHQFGVRALQANVPLVTTQSLLGHASPSTTAIYQHATGEDARRLMQRMWRQLGEN